MSVQVVKPDSYECSRENCDEEFPQPQAVKGSYCSRECAVLVQGEKLLGHLRRDHRFCHSCFRQLKEIERPTTEFLRSRQGVATDAIVGYEYLTPNAELGPANRVAPHAKLDPGAPGSDDPPAPADTLTVSGTTCTCGTTDHRDGWLRETETTSIPSATLRLCRILAFLGREGQHDKRVDARVLVDTLRETKQQNDELDWQRAVGRAILDE